MESGNRGLWGRRVHCISGSLLAHPDSGPRRGSSRRDTGTETRPPAVHLGGRWNDQPGLASLEQQVCFRVDASSWTMSTEYLKAKGDSEREALAQRIARLRQDGVPWDGPGGIVDSLHSVSSATQGRALLRKYRLDAKSGGPVEILDSYDRFNSVPGLGREGDFARRKSGRASRQLRSDPSAALAESPASAHQGMPRAPGAHGEGDRPPFVGPAAMRKKARSLILNPNVASWWRSERGIPAGKPVLGFQDGVR